jgi:FkbM family methyltransferase
MYLFLSSIWFEALLTRKTGVKIGRAPKHIDFLRGDKTVRLNKRHSVYSGDIMAGFDYYFDSVEPTKEDGRRIVDFSTPKFHKVTGFELMPIHFPSLAEPLETTNQYIQFAGLKPGDTVLDLGAYSGLTSILFKDIVGKDGRVVAVEADLKNLISLRTNIQEYQRISGMHIDCIQEAIWNHSRGVRFSTEGNMGSAASSIVGLGRGELRLIKSTTLSGIVDTLKLTKVSFVKVDIEGAEGVIFEDLDFFTKFLPRIIVEAHSVGGQLTTEKVMKDLSKFGYEFNVLAQPGVKFPLIECAPGK